MLKHPLFHFFVLLIASYLFYTLGIQVLSKPIPATLVSQYMAITLGVLLLYMATETERWERFKTPIYEALVGSTGLHRMLRNVLFVLIPLFAGFQTYQAVKPQTTPPPPFRTLVAEVDRTR